MNAFANGVFARLNSLFRSPGENGVIPVDADGFWMPRNTPTKSLAETALHFNQIGGQTIIEIGTGIHGEMSGNSMLVWPTQTSAKRIIGIDLETKHIEAVRSHTRQYSHVELVVGDGIEFLKRFESPIDLLYLDFWTPDPPGSLIGTGRAEAYRQAYAAAQSKLSAHSLILIDDTDHVHPWKHTFIVPDARKDGFAVIYTGRQTLLKR